MNISYNIHMIPNVWGITIGSHTIYKNDEQFYAFCQNQTGNNNLAWTQEVLRALRLLRNLRYIFYIRNHNGVDLLINHLDLLVQQSVEPDPVIPESVPDTPERPTSSSRVYLGSYLGHHRWAGDPSWLDQVD